VLPEEEPEGQTQTQRRRIQIDLTTEEPIVTRGLISDAIHINPRARNTTIVTTLTLATISTPSATLNTIGDSSVALEPMAIIKNTATPLGSTTLGPAATVSVPAAIVAQHDIP
jgi:hypothetical protein